MSVIGGLLRASPAGLGLAAGADAARLYERRGELAGKFQSNIVLPLDLNIESGAPYITMAFSEYTRRSIYNQPFFRDLTKIRLPIPDNLIENTDLNYDKSTNLGSVAGAFLESVAGGTSGGGTLQERINSIASGLGVGAAGLGINAAGSALAQSVPGLSQSSVQTAITNSLNAVQVLSGITLNPFQVVMFKSPSFKSHTFSWRIVPKSQQETEKLRELIEMFKYHSLPGISAAGGIFFSYPEILKVNFMPKSQYLYDFKPCVVESIQVNYAPNSPSFYRKTSAPTAIQFSIRLQEIEIWTKADYERVNGRLSTRPGQSLASLIDQTELEREARAQGA